jgi:hypothetical protein
MSRQCAKCSGKGQALSFVVPVLKGFLRILDAYFEKGHPRR